MQSVSQNRRGTSQVSPAKAEGPQPWVGGGQDCIVLCVRSELRGNSVSTIKKLKDDTEVAVPCSTEVWAWDGEP